VNKLRQKSKQKFGFVPPSLPLQTPEVLENLWQQTLAAYVYNPLSPCSRKTLCLPRLLCRSLHDLPVPCAPRDEGTRGLELLESPPKETDIDKHLSVLALTPGMLTSLPSNSALEESTLLFNIYLLEHDQAEYCRNELHRLLDLFTLT